MKKIQVQNMGEVTIVAPIGTLIGGDETMALHRKLEKQLYRAQLNSDETADEFALTPNPN